MSIHILKGHYVTNGGLLERGQLIVEREAGKFVWADQGNKLTAQEFKVSSGVTDTEIKGDGCIWTFVPAAGECARIGMPVAPL